MPARGTTSAWKSANYPTDVNCSAKTNDRSLADDVIRYLSEHPEAQDTVEGIVQWWLLEQRIRDSMADVTAALEEVMAQNLVLSRRGMDGRMHYRLNPDMKSEISQRLTLDSADSTKARSKVKLQPT